MARLERIVVVGASLAGLRAVEALRKRGFDGRLALVGAEPHLPYDRPPLSKEILRGEWEPERVRLCPPERWAGLELDLHLGRRAHRLDLAARAVELEGGERLPFDGLLIATGARPRTLPNPAGLSGIHVLRTLDDALVLRRALKRGPRVLVVGAGFIGAEVAASCRARGLAVTVAEALPVPLGRVLGAEIGPLCGALQRDHGVDLRCGVSVQRFEGRGRVERVGLSDGRSVEADLVVVGIGVVPETDWLAGSGLALDDGVRCDATCATGIPGVVAAGDVARWHNPLFDAALRVEHWMNASEQGPAAAATLLDGTSATPFANVPFFWSDQFGVKIQCAGLLRPGDAWRVVEGSLRERRFVALFGRGGLLTGAVAFDRPRALLRFRRRIAERARFEQALAEAGAA